MKAVNPILRGFHPDPSICRVGEDYYLVTSTLGFFPGLPIYHSRDLCRWEQVGNALSRPEQAVLDDCSVHSSGIYAPTLRYHNGRFYIVVANMNRGGTFIVTAENPAGPWSDPYWLGETVPGFDPSLFFDDDGTCYFTASRSNSAGERFNGDLEIWAQRLDIDSLQLVGERYTLWNGALNGAEWQEGSHLYKRDGWYYLIIAEGGTGFFHAVTVARSRNVTGPYEGYRGNPILTHRHLGRDCPVINVGHGDLVETPDGRWYMVALGSRPIDGYVLLGRETFLARVEWQDDWPVVNPGRGCLEENVDMPGVGEIAPPGPAVYTFTEDCLPPEFITLRHPPAGSWRTGDGLTLSLVPQTLADAGGCAFWGLRQPGHAYRLSSVLEFTPQADGEEAGIALVHSQDAHLRLVCRQTDGQRRLAVVAFAQGTEKLLHETDCPPRPLTLQWVINGLTAEARLVQGDTAVVLVRQVDLRFLSTEKVGGFVGCVTGVYASAHGRHSTNTACFRLVELA